MNLRSTRRIIIVGHSLGSIIGYDIIRHLWNEYNTKYADEKYKNELLEFERKYAKEVRPRTKDELDQFVKQYQSDQEDLLYQQYASGNPWRITHFHHAGKSIDPCFLSPRE